MSPAAFRVACTATALSSISDVIFSSPAESTFTVHEKSAQSRPPAPVLVVASITKLLSQAPPGLDAVRKTVGTRGFNGNDTLAKRETVGVLFIKQVA